MKSLAWCDVTKEYAEPIFNYLVHGYHPGSFWNSVFANDFMNAIGRSHPANSIPELKKAVTWIVNDMPTEAYGSYDKVDAWLKLSSEARRSRLEKARLIYTEQDEIIMILKDEPTTEPMLF